MQKRLQVLIDDTEYREIQHLARLQRVTLADWVRQALHKAITTHPSTMDAKLRAITDASQHHFPTTDIQTMLHESTPRWYTSLPCRPDALRGRQEQSIPLIELKQE